MTDNDQCHCDYCNLTGKPCWNERARLQKIIDQEIDRSLELIGLPIDRLEDRIMTNIHHRIYQNETDESLAELVAYYTKSVAEWREHYRKCVTWNGTHIHSAQKALTNALIEQDRRADAKANQQKDNHVRNT